MISARTNLANEKLSQEYNNLDYFKRSGANVEQLEISNHNEFWKYGDNVLVGHGNQTSPKCGTFNKFMGCLNIDGHNQARWFVEGLEKDSVFVKPIYHSCDKPTCPVCFKYGWAVREAYRMEARLKEASMRFGLPVEHIVRVLEAKIMD